MTTASVVAIITAIAGLVGAVTALVTAYNARGKATEAHGIATDASLKADKNGATIEEVKAIVNGGPTPPTT
jgi:hypothetical protein